jgi:hypothetical protein
VTKRITVTVNPQGMITVTASGQPGPKCLDEMATIQTLVQGATVVDSRLTPEFHQTATGSDRQQLWLSEDTEK